MKKGIHVSTIAIKVTFYNDSSVDIEKSFDGFDSTWELIGLLETIKAELIESTFVNQDAPKSVQELNDIN